MKDLLKKILSIFFTKKEEDKKEETVVLQKEEKIEMVCKYKKLDKQFSLSNSGKKRLAECCKELQDIVNEVLFYKDISITCGYRSNEEQEANFKKGVSKARAGQSAHNYMPSMAIDFIPYPIPMKDNKQWDNDSTEWKDLADLVKQIANEKHIEIEWGGDWKSLRDCPHYEIKGWKQKVKKG